MRKYAIYFHWLLFLFKTRNYWLGRNYLTIGSILGTCCGLHLLVSLLCKHVFSALLLQKYWRLGFCCHLTSCTFWFVKRLHKEIEKCMYIQFFIFILQFNLVCMSSRLNTIKILKLLVYFVVRININFWAHLQSCEKWQLYHVCPSVCMKQHGSY